LAQYYYLVSSLVELTLDEDFQKHPFPLFNEFVREEFSNTDYADLLKCFLLNDVLNTVSALKQKPSRDNAPFIEPSCYRKTVLEEGLADPDTLFSFLGDFIWDYRADKRKYPGVTEENELLRRMMESISTGEEPGIVGFPALYLIFEMHLRNLTTALSYRAANQEYSDLIIPFDFFSEKIANSQAPDFNLGGDLGVLSSLIDLYDSSSPLEIEKAITAVRWRWLDEAVGYNLFSREAVFAYGVKIADVERWLAITPEEGRAKLDELLEQLHQNIIEKTREENSE